MTPHETGRTLARVGLIGCVFACLLGAFAPARATHVLVEPGNPSAYKTINAALAAHTASNGAIDTVLVAKGFYPETLYVDDMQDETDRLIGLGAPGSVSVLNVTYGYTRYGYALEGLRFLERVVSAPLNDGHANRAPNFRGCTFEQGVTFDQYLCAPPNLFDCTLRANSALISYTIGANPPFSGLRFERCRLTVQSNCGWLILRDCVFTGCPDTAIVFRNTSGNMIRFEQCVVESAAVGFSTPSTVAELGVIDSQLHDLGVAMDLDAEPVAGEASLLVMSNVDVRRVGVGVRAITPWKVHAQRVVVDECAGAALDVSAQHVALSHVDVRRSRAGVVVRGVRPLGESGSDFRGVSIDSCSFEDIGGDAVTFITNLTTTGPVIVRSSTVARVAGHGFNVSASGTSVVGNVLSEVGGDGIRLHQVAPISAASIVGNTTVLVRGRGIAVERDSGTVTGAAEVAHNVAAFNGRAGISVGRFALADVQQNDAWRNSVADFDNVTDPLANNLSLDPMFCAAATGDFTLQDGSPCAPSGVYGLIGARPVACAASPAGVTSRSPVLALTVGPNPSLGSVRFALPSRAEAAEIEVLDLAGRRVWSAQIAAHAESLEWNGRVSGVRASGVFFARATQDGVRVTQRFVLLR